MALLIKDYDMPETCDECPCLSDGYWCNLLKDTVNVCQMRQRIGWRKLPNCPLVEIEEDGEQNDSV